MKRREFLKNAGALSLSIAAQSIAGYTIALPGITKLLSAATEIPLSSLQSAISPNDGLLLIPSHKDYPTYLASFNLRTALKPQVRLLCLNAKAIATAILWAKSNRVPFAIRCGGHSYEGFSQSTGLVIDTRLMSTVKVDAHAATAQVGGGSSLGHLYQEIGASGFAFPGGSCPPVGVSGHAQGGGFGLLSRAFGLACDNILSLDLVDANGKFQSGISQSNDPDRFWAIRGGGGGNFGVITNYQMRIHPLQHALVFGISWLLPPERAVKVMGAWQAWAPTAPSDITTIFRLTKHSSGNIANAVSLSHKTQTVLL